MTNQLIQKLIELPLLNNRLANGEGGVRTRLGLQLERRTHLEVRDGDFSQTRLLPLGTCVAPGNKTQRHAKFYPGIFDDWMQHLVFNLHLL